MGDRFKDQVVVVTGGGRGIGRATALEFACEGATLVLAGRRMDALQTAVGECVKSGGKASAVHCDVMKDEDIVHLVQNTVGKHGRIDVLVNNAGVVTGGPIDSIDKEDIGRMVGVNVWAPIRLTQLCVPHMREGTNSTIINISSIAGRMGMPYYATYCATKFAMRGFSEALRRELRPDGIHVIAVFPGGTATDMLETVDLGGVNMGIATADQVGRAIVRAVRWHQPEVFIGAGESLMARWNDMAPWTVDMGMNLMREQLRSAVGGQKTT